MKTYVQIRTALCTLLSFNALSSCFNTRQPLGMDQQPKDHTTQANPVDLGADSAPGDGVMLADPMCLNNQIVSDIQAHDYSLESIKSWLNKGLNIDAKDRQGETLLVKRIRMIDKQDDVRCGRPCTIEFLLGKGADVNAQDRAGNTVLLLEVQRIRHEIIDRYTRVSGSTTIDVDDTIVDLLVKYGADPNKKNMISQSALSYVTTAYENGGVLDLMSIILEKLKTAAKQYPEQVGQS